MNDHPASSSFIRQNSIDRGLTRKRKGIHKYRKKSLRYEAKDIEAFKRGKRVE